MSRYQNYSEFRQRLNDLMSIRNQSPPVNDANNHQKGSLPSIAAR